MRDDERTTDCTVQPGVCEVSRSQAGGTGPARSSTRSSFAVALLPKQSDAGTVELVIRRDPSGRGEGILGRTVWSEMFSDKAEATSRQKWLGSDTDRLDYLGWLASIVGPALAMQEMLLFWKTELERQEEERLRVKKERAEARRERREAREITAYFRDIGYADRPGITLERPCDDEPLLTLKFSEAWERARVWDWMKWQTDHWEDWRIRIGKVGMPVVERELLEEMLHTETRIKKAGLGAGGRRPLRFWRGDAS